MGGKLDPPSTVRQAHGSGRGPSTSPSTGSGRSSGRGSQGGKAVARKYPPAYCPQCHKPIEWTATWHSYLGHLGLHGLANRYFNGDIQAAQKRLRENGLARQDPAPWNGAFPKYKPIKLPALCTCCDRPATHVLGDWDLCQEHYNSLAGPWYPEPVEGCPGLDEEAF